MPIRIVNKTRNPINLKDKYGIIHFINASTNPAYVGTVTVEGDDVRMFNTLTTIVGSVKNLPEQKTNTIYIVSENVARHPYVIKRSDIYIIDSQSKMNSINLGMVRD